MTIELTAAEMAFSLCVEADRMEEKIERLRIEAGINVGFSDAVIARTAKLMQLLSIDGCPRDTPLDATFTAEVDVTKEGNGWHAPSVWTVDVLDVRPVSLAICAETIDVCTMSAASVECLREWCHDWLVDAGGDFVIEELIQGAGL